LILAHWEITRVIMGHLNQFSGKNRHYTHVQRPQLLVRVGGRVYRTVEWSYGGLLVEDEYGQLPIGALVRIDGLTDEHAYRGTSSPHAVDIRARVTRTMRDKGLAVLSCLKLDDAAFRFLNSAGGDFTEVQVDLA